MTGTWEPNPAPSDVEYFLNAIDELRGLCGLRATSYQAIRAAGLLRILLLDPPLLHRMKTATGLTPVYEVGRLKTYKEFEEYDPAVVSGVMLDPEVAREWMASNLADVPLVEPERLDLDKFLAYRVIDLFAPVSVKELIKWYANELGGAHREHSGERAARYPGIEKRLPQWEPVLRQSLIASSRIVLRALRPL